MNVREAKTWLLDQAKDRGVDLEVLSTSDRTLSIEAQGGELSDVRLATRGGIGLRVVTSGRVGYASSEELTEEALRWALDEAIENAELQPEGTATLPQGGALGRHDLLDEGLSAPMEDKVAAAVTLERGVRADARVQAVQVARYQEQEMAVEIGSSRGVDGGYRAGITGFLTSLVMRQGDSVKQGYEFDFRREFHQLDPGRTALDALDKVGRQLGAKPLKTGRRRAVFAPEVVASLFALFFHAVSGKNVAEGKSRLAGKIGQQIASEAITIVDDATLAGGLASRPFDAEGTASRRVVVVERGVLRSFLHNTDTAARTSQTTTGHASRSYASTLGVAPTNVILEPGGGVREADGVLVTDLMGVHAGANPITGDVSVQGMGIETKGGEAWPVEDFAVSFNLFELLMRVDEVGDDVTLIPGMGGGAMLAVSLAADGVSFAGG
ncbi:MAG: TldD/PmbA family protein [Trueperaceae bacterium]